MPRRVGLVPNFRPYLEGLSTVLPRSRIASSEPNAVARICYAVWLRHRLLSQLDQAPEVVVEVGPGASCGVGFAALLSGTSQVAACDAAPIRAVGSEIAVFDALTELFRSDAPIPGDDEFPAMYPKLDDYRHPSTTVAHGSLDPIRIQRLRDRLATGDNLVSYRGDVPAESLMSAIPSRSADLVLSQAVMQYATDLHACYAAIFDILKPGGTTTHQIDFGAHQTAATWDGHLAYGPLRWAVIKGRRRSYRPWLNRLPLSAHLVAMEASGLEIRLVEKTQATPTHHRSQRSGEDRTTRCAFVVAVRPT